MISLISSILAILTAIGLLLRATGIIPLGDEQKHQEWFNKYGKLSLIIAPLMIVMAFGKIYLEFSGMDAGAHIDQAAEDSVNNDGMAGKSVERAGTDSGEDYNQWAKDMSKESNLPKPFGPEIDLESITFESETFVENFRLKQNSDAAVEAEITEGLFQVWFQTKCAKREKVLRIPRPFRFRMRNQKGAIVADEVFAVERCEETTDTSA